MELESLYQAYKASRKHNRRSEDMVAFEMDLYANLARLCERINSRTYVPLHNYSFMHRRSQNPREVFAAEPELKTMMAFALSRIAHLVEARLSSRTFNNRVGMGAQLAVNTLIEDIYAVSKGYAQPCWIIKLDYKGYFPNMIQEVAFRQFLDIIEKDYHGSDVDDVIYCLKVACFTDAKRSRRKSPLWEWGDIPTYKSAYSRPPGIGAMIGYHLWQIETSLYPVEIDNFIAENVTPYYVRFVDDSVLATDNKEMVLSMMPEIRRMCAELDITMHPEKFYCQPYQRGIEFLGYHIAPGRVHLNRRIVNHAFLAAKDKTRGVTSYINSVNSYLGMIKGTSDMAKARELLDLANRPWIGKDYQNLKIYDTRRNT